MRWGAPSANAWHKSYGAARPPARLPRGGHRWDRTCAQSFLFPVGIVMRVVVPESPLLRNSMPMARTIWSTA